MSLDEMMPWGEMSESVYLPYLPIIRYLLMLLLYMQIQYRENGNSGRHAAASLAMHTESGHICLGGQLIDRFFLLLS